MGIWFSFVDMLKPSLYVTKKSEFSVAYRDSGLLQKVWACGKVSKLERLGLCGFCVRGAFIYAKRVPLIPYVV